MSSAKIESLKVVIDLLGLDIENLVYAEKKEAIKALEHSLLTLMEDKGQITNHKEKDKGQYTCETCGKQFAGKYGMIRHKNIGESACQKILKKQHENITGKLACAECSYKTSSKNNLRFHILKHTNKYSCEKCNLKYGKKSELVYHLLKNHPEMPEEDWPIKRITQREGNISCPKTDCNYKTNSKRLLNSHRIQHTDRYKCENCHHRYGRKGDLVMHKSNPENCQKYLKLREFSCLECGKRYKDKFSLTRHEIAIH